MSGRPLIQYPSRNCGFAVIVANLGAQLSDTLCAPSSRPSPEPSPGERMTAAAALQANRPWLATVPTVLGQSIVVPSITHIEPCISRHDRTVVAACLRRNGNHGSSNGRSIIVYDERYDEKPATQTGTVSLSVQWRKRYTDLIQVFAPFSLLSAAQYILLLLSPD